MKRGMLTVLGIVLGCVGLMLGLIYGLPAYFDRRGHADQVQTALLLGDGGREVLALAEIVSHESDDGPNAHRITLLDPTSGKRVGRRQLEASRSSGTLVGKGQRFLLFGEKLFALYDLRNSERLERAQLEAKLPAVLTPWHVWGINPNLPGVLLVESDDMKWWEVDLGTLQARPTTARPESSISPVCASATSWEPGLESDGGEVYVILNQPIKRYSQASTLALARAKRLQYGSPVEPKFLGDARWSGTSRPTFAATPSGGALVLREPESALVLSYPEARRVALHRVTPQGKVLWATELVDDEKSGACAVIPYRDGLLVLRHRLLYSLAAADGKLRWQQRL